MNTRENELRQFPRKTGFVIRWVKVSLHTRERILTRLATGDVLCACGEYGVWEDAFGEKLAVEFGATMGALRAELETDIRTLRCEKCGEPAVETFVYPEGLVTD